MSGVVLAVRYSRTSTRYVEHKAFGREMSEPSANASVLTLRSGVTERLGALGHIDTRGPFTTSPSVGLNARPKGLTAVFA